MTVAVALLRGINVGGHRKVPMADLRAGLEDAGFEDVRTYVQSGNVVLRGDAQPDDVAAAVQRVVAERCGVPDVAVVVRSAEELAAVVEGNPFPEAVETPKLLHVGFCSAQPAADAVAAIADRDWAPNAVAFRGREVYSHHPEGFQASKLAAALTDKRLGVRVTDRNWNTVLKLLEMTSQ